MGAANQRILNKERAKKLNMRRELSKEAVNNLVEESKSRIYDIESGIQTIRTLEYEADVAKETINEMREQIQKLKKEKVSKQEKESVKMQIHILENYIKNLEKKTLSAEDIHNLRSKEKMLEARRKALLDNIVYMRRTREKRTGEEEPTG